MSTVVKPLDELIQELSPNMRDEVRHFVEFLLAKQERETGKKLRQDWAGALREYRQEYTSLDLQAKALEWRGD
jgi:hypothetical protein